MGPDRKVDFQFECSVLFNERFIFLFIFICFSDLVVVFCDWRYGGSSYYNSQIPMEYDFNSTGVANQMFLVFEKATKISNFAYTKNDRSYFERFLLGERVLLRSFDPDMEILERKFRTLFTQTKDSVEELKREASRLYTFNL